MNGKGKLSQKDCYENTLFNDEENVKTEVMVMVKKWERQRKKTNRDVVYEKRKQKGEKVNEHYY